MKRKIRMSCFETNSSAVHCLVVPRDMLEKSELRKTKDGKIKVKFLDEIDGYLDTQSEKLSYLVTQIYYANCGFDVHNLEDDYEFKILEEYVCDYTGATGIQMDYKTEPGINHQAQWCYRENVFIDIYDKDAVISFIFGPMMVKEYMD